MNPKHSLQIHTHTCPQTYTHASHAHTNMKWAHIHRCTRMHTTVHTHTLVMYGKQNLAFTTTFMENTIHSGEQTPFPASDLACPWDVDGAVRASGSIFSWNSGELFHSKLLCYCRVGLDIYYLGPPFRTSWGVIPSVGSRPAHAGSHTQTHISWCGDQEACPGNWQEPSKAWLAEIPPGMPILHHHDVFVRTAVREDSGWFTQDYTNSRISTTRLSRAQAII